MGRKNVPPHKRKSYRYRPDPLPDEFNRFVQEKAQPLVKLRGIKLREKRKHIKHQIHKLIKAGMRRAVVADSRSTSKGGARLRIEAWDALRTAGLAGFWKGSESEGKVSRYWATEKLMDLRRRWRLPEIVKIEREPLVIVKPPKRDPHAPTSLRQLEEQHSARWLGGAADPADVAERLAAHLDYAEAIERINRNNVRKHAWTFTYHDDSDQPRDGLVDPRLRLQHAGDIHRAARLWSWGEFGVQSLRKKERRTIRIDDEATIELDFSGMHLRMLYHAAGVDAKGDVYLPKQILPRFSKLANANDDKKAVARGFVKTATNIMLNVRSKYAAKRVVPDELKKQKDWDTIKRILKFEGIAAADLVDRIIAAHPAIAHPQPPHKVHPLLAPLMMRWPRKGWFFRRIGVELMTYEGFIMFGILSRLAKAGIPATGLHDAVVCKAADKDVVKRAMIASYCWLFDSVVPSPGQPFKFEPIIKLKR